MWDGPEEHWYITSKLFCSFNDVDNFKLELGRTIVESWNK